MPNYLRRFRRRAGFSQKEIAFLLGAFGKDEVSKHETFARKPRLATALLYERLFGVPLRELFAGVYEEALQALDDRARLLAERLQEERGAERKRQALQALISRIH
ncbi:MAG TPA: helix-turn-helix domain-containing protein [Pyrinomonadaceae bacterium]